MEQDIIRVLRIIEYVGLRNKVENTVKRSIHGEKSIEGMTIKAVTLGTVSEILGTTEYTSQEDFILVTATRKQDESVREKRIIPVASIREVCEIDGGVFIFRDGGATLKVTESIDELYAQIKGGLEHGTR